MGKALAVTSPDAWHGIAFADGAAPLDGSTWHRDGADVHLIVIDDKDILQARCSLWWSAVPRHGQFRLGTIGHYAACDNRAASTLLAEACHQLAENGCDYAVGPMDGSTWKSYRFVTDPGDQPPFFLEPVNSSDYPEQFVKAGFDPYAEYLSALRSGPIETVTDIGDAERRLDALGVIFRQIDMKRLENELLAVHRASLLMFRDNVLYSPISEDDFLALYLPVLPMTRPETFLLAERNGELVGFIFGIPDYLQAQRGQHVDTLIIKTLARHPGPDYTGLGAVLLRRCETIGLEQFGWHRSIHALMHVNNASIALSKRSAIPIRRYALFGKDLTS